MKQASQFAVCLASGPNRYIAVLHPQRGAFGVRAIYRRTTSSIMDSRGLLLN